MSPAAFYFDLASPYAYLASVRVEAELGAAGVAEIEDRASRYGLADWRWPDPYPANALKDANDRAIAEGVYGVPTFDAGGLLWWGDGQLAAAGPLERRNATHS